MLTIYTALTTLSSCTAARWYLHRSSRRDTAFCHGRVRLTGLWNDGWAFRLPLPKTLLRPVSSAATGAAWGAVWYHRKKAPIGAGLLLGGGLSNQLERLLHHRVYDYVQFPKAPEPLRRYVFNLADFAILAGGLSILCRQRKP